MIPDELINLLQINNDYVRYATAKVTATQTSAGTVSLAWNGGTALNVPYLTSYTPAINDKVHVLAAGNVGMLVIGKTVAVAAPSTGTTRVAYITPNNSMSWQGNPRDNATTGSAATGIVRQGSTVTYLYSGAYRYPAGSVTLTSTEIVVKAELLISRLSSSSQTKVAPVLNELVTVLGTGRPVVGFPERSYTSTEMLPGDTVWSTFPVSWARNIVKGTSLGICFSPTSAQLAMVYSEYASYTTVVDTTTTSVAGRIRLTIQNS